MNSSANNICKDFDKHKDEMSEKFKKSKTNMIHYLKTIKLQEKVDIMQHFLKKCMKCSYSLTQFSV